MKKTVLMFLAAAMLALLLVSCTGGKNADRTDDTADLSQTAQTDQTTEPVTTAAPEAGGVTSTEEGSTAAEPAEDDNTPGTDDAAGKFRGLHGA